MWIRIFLILFLATSFGKAAAPYLSFTNIDVNFSLTNWAGATNRNWVFMASAGDSIAAGYREPPGSVPYPTPEQVGILMNHSDWRQTNVAVPGTYFYEIFPAATNVLWTRKPRFLHLGSPANDAVSFVNFPTTMWETLLPTNDMIVSICRSNGTSLLFMEFIPRSTDYKPIADDWNSKGATWAARSTNSDVVTWVRCYDFLKDSGNPAFMQSQYTSDNLHCNALGHTNYCLLLATGMVSSLCHTSSANTWSGVSNAYYLSKAGDSVYLKAESNNFAGTIYWTNAVALRGAGLSSSVIGMSGGVLAFRFDHSYARGKHFVYSDFQVASGPSPPAAGSTWYETADCNTNGNYFIFDQVWANQATGPAPLVVGGFGVFSNHRWSLTNAAIGLYIYDENHGGGLYSSGSFSEAVDYSSDQFVWVEDSWVTRAHSAGSSYAFTDAYRGARYGVRRTALTNSWLEAHGTESGFVRGTRAVISAWNLFYGNGVQNYGHNFRSGTALIYSNQILNAAGAANFAHLAAYRMTTRASPWGGASGDLPIDDNDTTVYDNGTATGGGEKSLTDSGKSWTVNQWVGYTLARTNNIAAGYTFYTDFRHGHIVANTATSITVADTIDTTLFPNIVFASSDRYWIRKLETVFDQPGAGRDTVAVSFQKNTAASITANVITCTKAGHGLTTGDIIILGDLIVGADAITTMAVVTVSGNNYTLSYTHADGTASANYEGHFYKIVPWDQTVDPCYEIGNTKEGGVDVDFSNGYAPAIAAGVHYFDDTMKPGYTELAYPNPRLLLNSTYRLVNYSSASAGSESSGGPAASGLLGIKLQAR